MISDYGPTLTFSSKSDSASESGVLTSCLFVFSLLGFLVGVLGVFFGSSRSSFSDSYFLDILDYRGSITSFKLASETLTYFLD